MFYGEYQHTIDQKGRIIVPSKFRFIVNEEYVEKFYITKGLDNCLWGFTEKEFRTLEEKLKPLPFTDINTRKFIRLFFTGTCVLSCDKQGRILLPQNLIEYGGLHKDIVIAGVQTRFEIWDKQRYAQFQSDAISMYEELAQHIDFSKG